jgi:hypothetical protein
MSISAFTRVFDALWKSGYRFSDKDMRKTRNLGRIPIDLSGMRPSAPRHLGVHAISPSPQRR